LRKVYIAPYNKNEIAMGAFGADGICGSDFDFDSGGERGDAVPGFSGGMGTGALWDVAAVWDVAGESGRVSDHGLPAGVFREPVSCAERGAAATASVVNHRLSRCADHVFQL